MKESIKDLIEQEAKAILNLPIDDEYERAIDMIVDHIHNNNGKLITSGMGKAGQIAMNMATTLAVSSQTPGQWMRPSSTRKGSASVSGNTTSL